MEINVKNPVLFKINKSNTFSEFNEIQVFENQRFLRGWASKFLKKLEDPPYISDEQGIIENHFSNLDDIPCPAGWQWASDWKLNFGYTNTGKDGWCYGTSFLRIRAKFAANCSSSSPTPRQTCRRRLWLRYLKPHDDFELNDKSSNDSDVYKNFITGHSIFDNQRKPHEKDVFESTIVVDVFENQRWNPGLEQWGRHFLRPGQDNPPFCDKNGRAHVVSLSQITAAEGYVWDDDWHVAKFRGKTDWGGFVYAEWDAPEGAKRAGDKPGERQAVPHLRVRKWTRTQRRSKALSRPATAPFELVVTLVEVTGKIPLRTRVLVELELDGRPVGRSASSTAVISRQARAEILSHSSVPDGLRDALVDDDAPSPSVRTTTVLWERPELISVPLSALSSHSLRFNILKVANSNYSRPGRGLLIEKNDECNTETELLGRAFDSQMLNADLWPFTNRKVVFRGSIRANDGSASSGQARPTVIGQVTAMVEVVEHSLFHYSFDSMVAHFPFKDPRLQHASPARLDGSRDVGVENTAGDKYNMVMLLQTSSRTFPRVFPSGMSSWLWHTCLLDESFPLQLFLTEQDIEHVCICIDALCTANNDELGSRLLPLSRGLYPFCGEVNHCEPLMFPSSIGAMTPCTDFISIKYPACCPLLKSLVSQDLTPPPRNIVFAASKHASKLIQFEPESVVACSVAALTGSGSHSSVAESPYCAAIVTKSAIVHSFKFATRRDYCDWIKAVYAVKSDELSRGISPGEIEPYSQRLLGQVSPAGAAARGDNFDRGVDALQMCKFDIVGKVLYWTEIHDPKCSSNPESNCCSRKLHVSDIDFIQTNASYALSHKFLLRCELLDVGAIDVPVGGSVVVTAIASSGQVQCVRYLSQAKGPTGANGTHVDLFVCESDIVQDDSVLLGVHMEVPTLNGGLQLKTIGEANVRLNVLLHSALCSSKPHSSHNHQSERDSNPEPVGASNKQTHVHLNTPTIQTVRLSPPRHSIVFRIIQASGLMACDVKTSDAYCVLRIVDHTGTIISAAKHKTKVVGSTLNPVWNSEVVFGHESGFLLGTYLHIEIRDKNVIKASECMGEVYFPLKSLTSSMEAVTMPVEWSPKMQSCKENSRLGTITVAGRVVMQESSHKSYTEILSLQMKSALSLVSGNDAKWRCVPLSTAPGDFADGKISTVDLLYCWPDASFFNIANAFGVADPTVQSLGIAASCPALPSKATDTSHKGNYLAGILRQLTSRESKASYDVTKSAPTENSILLTEKSAAQKSQLKTERNATSMKDAYIACHSETSRTSVLTPCTECSYDASGGDLQGVRIPWNQVEDVAMLADGMLSVSVSVHRLFPNHQTRRATVELLIGPCPAQSLLTIMRDHMQMHRMESSLGSVLNMSQISEHDKEDVHVLLQDLCEANYELHLQRNRLDSNLMSSLISYENKDSLQRDDSKPSSGTHCAILVNLEQRVHAKICASSYWRQVASKRIRIALAVGLLVRHCTSRMLDKPSYGLEDINQLLKNKSIEFGAHIVHESGPSSGNGNGNGDVSELDRVDEESNHAAKDSFGSRSIANLSDLSSFTMAYLTDLLLCGWDHFKAVFPDSDFIGNFSPEDSAAAGAVREIMNASLGHVHHLELPKIFDILDVVFNAYFNRAISLVGQYSQLDKFSKTTGQESKLSLLHFIIINDNQHMAFYNALFSLFNLATVPSPRLSITIDVEKVLNQFSGLLESDLQLYITRAILGCSCKDGDSSFMWEYVELLEGTVIGPIPEAIATIISTYVNLVVDVDEPLNFEGKATLHKMNTSIAHAVLNSYKLVLDAFSTAVTDIKTILIQHYQRSDEVESSTDTFGHVKFLCSVANDSHRIIAKHMTCTQLGALFTETETAVTRQELLGICWSAIELIARAIFVDQQELFILGMVDVTAVPCNNQPAVTPSACLQELLACMEGYLLDLKKCLYTETFHKLLLSCCNKMAHRYFILLRECAYSLVGLNASDGRGLDRFPLLQKVVNAVKSSASSAAVPSFALPRAVGTAGDDEHSDNSSNVAVAEESTRLHPSQVRRLQTDVDLMTSFFGKHFLAVANNMPPIFNQLLLCLECISCPYCEISRNIEKILSLGAGVEIAYCVLVLRGEKAESILRFVREAVQGGDRRASPAGDLVDVIDVSAAIRTCFQSREGRLTRFFERKSQYLESEDNLPLSQQLGLDWSLPVVGLDDNNQHSGGFAQVATKMEDSLLGLKVSHIECTDMPARNLDLGRWQIYVKCSIDDFDSKKTRKMRYRSSVAWMEQLIHRLPKNYSNKVLVVQIVLSNRFLKSDRIIGTTRVSLAALPSGTSPESGEEDWKVVNVPHNVFGIGDTLEEVAEDVSASVGLIASATYVKIPENTKTFKMRYTLELVPVEKKMSAQL